MKNAAILLAAGAALMLSACQHTPYAGYSNEPLAQVGVVANPDCDQNGCSPGSNRNPSRIVPAEALTNITRYGAACQEDIGRQVAGPLQSAGVLAVTSGATGLATGPAARYSFGPWAKAWDYAGYGGVVGLAQGANTGLLMGAQSNAVAKSDCIKGHWSDVSNRYPGVHVVTVTGGKAPGNHIKTQAPPPR